jgi:hypothetical protein
MRVTQIMEPDTRYASSFDGPLEGMGYSGVVERATIQIGEHKVIISEFQS